MSWSEHGHPRDWAGRFTHAAVSGWAEEMSHRLNLIGLRRGDRRPEGFDAAVGRAEHLWSLGDWRTGRERTDTQQAELEALEQAFETFRGVLELRRDDRATGSQERYTDAVGRQYDRYGRHLGGSLPLNGSGRAKSRSSQAKANVRSRRSEDGTSTPDDRERRARGDGGKIGRRFDGAPAAFLAEMKRAKARARTEGSARQPVRRTPRGTRVDGWMSEINKRMGGRRG